VNTNPYQTPGSDVVDYLPPDPDGAGFDGQPRSLPIGRAVDWLKEGWGLFMQAPGLWILIYLTFFGIMLAAAFFPLVGSLVQNLLFPVLVGGLAMGCDAMRRGQPLEFAHLFAGFSRNSSQLFMLGVLYTAAMLVMLLIAFVPTVGLSGGMALFGGGDPDALAAALGLPLMLGLLIYLALAVPMLMAIWFAPHLVILNDVPPVEALKLSFFGCLKNILPFLLYGILTFLLAIVATLPLLLGWLVLMPWLMTSTFSAYRDIYYN